MILAQGHSAAGHDGPHTSRPTAEAVWPTRFCTVGLVQSSKWPNRPATERPTDPRRRARALARSPHAGVAWCLPSARWPRWKTMAEVSTDVERRTRWARSQGGGSPRRWHDSGVAKRPQRDDDGGSLNGCRRCSEVHMWLCESEVRAELNWRGREEGAWWRLSPRRGDDVDGTTKFSMRGGASTMVAVKKGNEGGGGGGLLVVCFKGRRAGERNGTRRHQATPFLNDVAESRGKGGTEGSVARRMEGGDGEAGPDRPRCVRTTPRCLNRVAQGASDAWAPTDSGRERERHKGRLRKKGNGSSPKE
jgi:hypothetical protein